MQLYKLSGYVQQRMKLREPREENHLITFALYYINHFQLLLSATRVVTLSLKHSVQCWGEQCCEEGFQNFILTSTHQAIKNGDQPALEQWLQKEDTNVNKCKGGNAYWQTHALADGTALHWAVYYGELKIAQLLLDKGAGMFLIAGQKLLI